MLVEDPPASEDPAGVDLPPVELLQHGGTVLGRFEHLTGKVPFNVELDLVGISAGLEEEGKGFGKMCWMWMGREKVD